MPIVEGPFQNVTSLFKSASGVAVITGTVLAFLDEQEVRDGSETIIITLTDATWPDAGSAFDAVRQDIIDGLDSAQSETLGWNNEVRDTIPICTLVRTSNTIVTITL